MRLKATPPYPSVIAIFLFCICFSGLIERSQAQATTDPSEVRALNSIFQQWDTKANDRLWNISGEPCSGAAINATDFEDPDFNPAIKCDCDYENRSTCHITHLRVYALNKKGVIPEELVNLTYLVNLYAFFSNFLLDCHLLGI
ncbi:hypothetical protein HHK36_004746 [Tetracentron sinense]|uniref:Uncharacterized protein n=1 Tax=Tetracentron sinense TaxID=13715 RepID=A0A834ZP52_TETSI|nr:hypothetical protein HHK36_004746 [Tetracentron sinense]